MRHAARLFALLATLFLAGSSAALAEPVRGYTLAAFGPEAAGAARLGAMALYYRAAPPELHYSQRWLETLPAARGNREWECLTQALYFEARGEPVKGQFAVAEVILNRVDAPGYPKSICGVVHQGGAAGCQFSFTCDGRSDTIRERAAYVEVGKVARLMLDGAPRALTDGATHFHTRAVQPGWAQRLPRTASIGQHLFYRDTGST